MRHLMPVGRLDKERAECSFCEMIINGLKRMTNPKSHVGNCTMFKWQTAYTAGRKTLFETDLYSERWEHYVTLPANASREGILSYRIGLTEGKNRQVRKMFKAAERTSFRWAIAIVFKIGRFSRPAIGGFYRKKKTGCRNKLKFRADAGISKRNYWDVCFRRGADVPEYLLFAEGTGRSLYPGLWQIITGTRVDGEDAPALCAAGGSLKKTGLKYSRFWPVPATDSFYDHRRDVNTGHAGIRSRSRQRRRAQAFRKNIKHLNGCRLVMREKN